MSAGEGWASWFRANNRAHFFGRTTTGASARKDTETLPGGQWQVRYSVKLYRGFLDRPIERRGIEPDVPVSYTAADIAASEDTVLNAAIEWLREEMVSE